MITEQEIWKDIIGYEEFYEISTFGRIRTKPIAKYRGRGIQNRPSVIMKFWKNEKGYSYATLCKDSKRRGYRVNRMVAIHFIDNPQNKPTVNHKDNDINNNHVYNLEWATYPEQQIHNIMRVGKFKEEYVISIRNSQETYTQLAKMYNVCVTTISRIKNNERWTHVK